MGKMIEVCGIPPERPWKPGDICVMPVGHEAWTTDDSGRTVHRAVRRDGLSYTFLTFPEGYEPVTLSELIKEIHAFHPRQLD